MTQLSRTAVRSLRPVSYRDAVGIRPVGFHRNGRELFLLDEPFSDFSADRIELVRVVRSFTNQYEPGVSNQFQKRIVIGMSRGRKG